MLPVLQHVLKHLALPIAILDFPSSSSKTFAMVPRILLCLHFKHSLRTPLDARDWKFHDLQRHQDEAPGADEA